MHEAIATLRATGDACGSMSEAFGRNDQTKAALVDAAVKWHWLANEVAAHCRLTKELSVGGDAECKLCAETRLDGTIAPRGADEFTFLEV
jgi:hypothetical protein